MWRYVLPGWVIGAVGSFALPVVLHWAVWAAVFLLLLWAALRWKPAVLLVCTVLGAAYGVWRTEAALGGQWPLNQIGNAALTVEVADLPASDGRRVRFKGKARDTEGRKFVLLLSDYQLREWPVGSVWEVTARVRPIVGEVNVRGLNREAWALANGLDGTGNIGKQRKRISDGSRWNIAAMRERISLNWQQVTEKYGNFSDGIGLMRALGIGEQTALRSDLWQAFRPLGLTHLVSISGLHVTMVALMFGWLVKQILRVLPAMPAKPKLWILIGGLAGALAYALLAGFSVPTQRSVLMLAALAWAWYGELGKSLWRGWWLALSAVLLFEPAAVLGAGIWLSFGLVGGLIWVSSDRLNLKVWHAVLRAQWAAAVLSVVLLGYIFASFPLLSPLVNLIAIPWFSWILTPLALIGSVFPFEPLQWLAGFLGEYSLRGLVWLSAQAPEWPVSAAPWPLAVAAFVAALMVLLPRGSGLKPLSILILMGFLLYRPSAVPENRLKMTVLDAGQGLSVLLQTSRHTLLFDAATAHVAASGIVPSLNALGIRFLDKVIVSHHDSDHDGGLPAVLAVQPVRALLAGQPEFYPQAELCRETSWQWDGVVFEILRPSEFAGRSDNDQSCVLRAVANGQAVLITGDLGQQGEDALVKRYGSALYSSVLVLGHHGSNSSSSGTFLNQVAPRYAVASSGYANPFKHPVQAVQTRVRAHGIRLLRTDLSGALVFETGSGDVFKGRLKTDKFYWQKKPFE